MEGDRMAPLGSWIIGHRHAYGVFVGTGAKLGEAMDLHIAGVGGENQFSPFEHQDAGAFGEFAVIADHCAKTQRTLRGVERADVEVIAGRQGPLFRAEVAGMDLGIGHGDVAMTIDQRHGITGRAVPLFEVGDGNSHVQLFCQSAKIQDEGIIATDGQVAPELTPVRPLQHCTRFVSPAFGRALEIGTVGYRAGGRIGGTPHFREEGNIRAHRVRTAAEGFAFRLIRLSIMAAGGDL